VGAVSADIPLKLVQNWLEHAILTTTAIYVSAVGAEELDVGRRMGDEEKGQASQQRY
jgi:hypothetical protein